MLVGIADSRRHFAVRVNINRFRAIRDSGTARPPVHSFYKPPPPRWSEAREAPRRRVRRLGRRLGGACPRLRVSVSSSESPRRHPSLCVVIRVSMLSSESLYSHPSLRVVIRVAVSSSGSPCPLARPPALPRASAAAAAARAGRRRGNARRQWPALPPPVARHHQQQHLVYCCCSNASVYCVAFLFLASKSRFKSGLRWNAAYLCRQSPRERLPGVVSNSA